MHLRKSAHPMSGPGDRLPIQTAFRSVAGISGRPAAILLEDRPRVGYPRPARSSRRPLIVDIEQDGCRDCVLGAPQDAARISPRALGMRQLPLDIGKLVIERRFHQWIAEHMAEAGDALCPPLRDSARVNRTVQGMTA